MIRKSLLAGFILVLLFAAPAAAQYDFTVDPPVIQPGGTVTVSGKGCAPGATITITVTQKSTGKVVLTTTGEADESGEFSIEVTLDESLAVGIYVLEARCPLPDCNEPPTDRSIQGEVEGCELVFTQEIELVSPPANTTTTEQDTDDGTIVRTGSDLNGLGLLGAGLLVAGGLVLIASKTRRRSAET